MVPLYRLTGEKCNFCTYIVSGAPNGPPIQGDWGKVQWHPYKADYLLTVKKCNFCKYIVTGAPNGPPIHADK